MKTKNHLRTLKNTGLLIVLTLAATLIVAVSSCGKTKNPQTAESKIAPPPAATDIVYTEVDEMPVFPEGDSGLLKFIANNAKYPEDAKKNNITGKVIVKFVVGKDCMISNVEVLNSVYPSLDAEAVRVVNSLPKFEKPAKKDGVAVSVNYMIPIAFALK